MYQFAAAQQTRTAELPAFFLRRFETERVLRVNKGKITGENTFNGDYFGVEGNHESSKMIKFCFGYFCRFVTSALTRRPWNTYKYVFLALFDFCNFSATSCGFWKLGISSFPSTPNFE